MLVHTSSNDHNDFDRRYAGATRIVDPIQYPLNRELQVADRTKNPVVDRVQADRDSAKPGFAQCFCGLERQ